MSPLLPVRFPGVDAPPGQLEALLPPMEFSAERLSREVSGGRTEQLDGRELWLLCLRTQTSPKGQDLIRWAELTARMSQLAMAHGYLLGNVGSAIFRACCRYIDLGESSAERMAEGVVLDVLRNCWKHGEAFYTLYDGTSGTPGDHEVVGRILNEAWHRQQKGRP